MEATQNETYATEREKLLEMVVEDSLERKVDYEFEKIGSLNNKCNLCGECQ
jgi:hypothetical protein